MNTYTHALARRPAATLAQGLTQQRDHYGAPHYDLTLEQYEAYLKALEHCGVSLEVLPPDSRFPDGHYVEDTAVIFRDIAIITRPGAKSRLDEAESIAEHLGDLNVVPLLGEDVRLDGGDVLFFGDHMLIGLSKRTNRVGAEQLAYALTHHHADLKVEFVQFEGVLHLKSGLTALTDELLVRAPQLKTDFRAKFADTIMLPPEEGYAANLLPINDAILIPAGFPYVHQLAQKHYSKIFLLEMSEFQKMDGGLTCLSLRY